MRELGKVRRNARTLSGAIEFSREVYECSRCRRAWAPLDAELGLRPSGARMTRSVVRKAAYVAANAPYPQASRDLLELTGLSISPGELALIAQEEGGRFDQRQREREARRNEPFDPYAARSQKPEMVCERLVIEADATTVLTVKGEEHKSVYCAVAFGLESRGKKAGRPFVTEKRYAASAQDMEDFGPRLKALAWRMGLRETKEAAFLGDGARCLWKWAEENLPAGTVFIQDFWHVCEHLAGLAKELFDEASWRGRFLRWKRALRESRLDSILRSLRAERIKRKGRLRERIEEEIAYLETGRRRMDYARYEREGWLIGSGAAEATCKHLVKSRFCVTGAQWRRKNIAQTLALRLSIFNEEWDEDWNEDRRGDCRERLAA